MKNILFDLDGTLLPMDEDAFTNMYFGFLCKKMAPYGFEPSRLVKTIWKGTEAMYGNDGHCTNEDAFWHVYEEEYREPKEKHHRHFTEFYDDEFIVMLTIDGTSYDEIEVKVTDPNKTIRDQINSIVQVFELPKMDNGGNPIQYLLGKLMDGDEEPVILEFEDEEGREMALIDYDIQPMDHLHLISVPIAG